ncbi:Polysaccharide pyruvyl transferase [Desulfosporosinus orientis DSM 765]|uniref:Polysaccharide pyruvyl transferase n=1 Tax=Desulfosporosinus orientis (strain ATCC 19365 / DSM 765 / NCIMB 8382 / VKM B-1628 / Singapore I) TaxID=768706 RepID=G7W766_DESOD|nr:polysaccharide pyruvyl transferase family protein [Desulfosporosinus orientis]AET70574.1 Polysaccharide pyruvyl transferase [Desulfosporosinus orientis DSM 765]
MKNVAVLTLCGNGNYGASLQAYALNWVIRKFGFNCKTVKYERKFSKGSIPHQSFKSKLESVLNQPSLALTLPHRLLMNVLIINKLRQRDMSFSNFETRSIPKTERKYVGASQLFDIVNDFDTFVCGSDNIWKRTMFDPAMALDFVPQNKIKFSYAAGLSAESLSEIEIENMILPISRLNAISVRESFGRKLLSQYLDKPVVQNADPTLLLTREEWLDVTEPIESLPEKYIFCYFLGKSKEHRKYAKALSRQLHLPIVTLPHMYNYNSADSRFGDVNLYSCSPAQFVNCYEKAEYVLTDAYHGSIFAIIFNKQFISFYRFFSKSKIEDNNRLISLFEYIGMNNRVARSEAEFFELFQERINYAEIQGRLQTRRLESLEYLSNMLNQDCDHKTYEGCQ